MTIFDRSLELYAKQYHYWADALWAPPAPPPGRADGAQTGYGMSLPGDEAEALRAQQRDPGPLPADGRLPRFSWEETLVQRRPRLRRRRQAARRAPRRRRRRWPRRRPGAGRARRDEEVAQATNGDNDADGIVDGKDKAEEESGGEQKEKGKAPPPPPADLRTNMAETAAWIPDVALDGGKGTFSFTAPERLTSWRVQILALGRAVEAGIGEDTFATKKPLMVRVEIPRFFREGDRSTIIAVVHNETDAPLTANVDLDIVDDATDHSGLEALGIKQKSSARRGAGARPDAGGVRHRRAREHRHLQDPRAAPRAGKLHDAEERGLPILPSRERLVQSRVVALHGSEQQDDRVRGAPALQGSVDALGVDDGVDRSAAGAVGAALDPVPRAVPLRVRRADAQPLRAARDRQRDLQEASRDRQGHRGGAASRDAVRAVEQGRSAAHADADGDAVAAAVAGRLERRAAARPAEPDAGEVDRRKRRSASSGARRTARAASPGSPAGATTSI